MPLTGNQATSARRFQEDVELADDPWVINQIIGAINGTFGLPFKLIGYNSGSDYALTISNADPTTGGALLIYDNASSALMAVEKAITLIQPALRVRDVSSNVLIDALAASTTIRPRFIVKTASGTALFDASSTSVGIGDSSIPTAMIGSTLDLYGTPVRINGVQPYSSANPPPGSSVTGTYTGDGAVTQRQITTGFQCKAVILQRPSTSSTWTTMDTSNSLFMGSGPTVQQQSAVHLHSSDGFWVADGSVNGNTNGETFNYVAFR